MRAEALARCLILSLIIGLAPQIASACPDINGLVDINCDGKLQIVTFGDSITRGVGDSTKRGYPGRLQRLIPETDVINVGVSSETTPRGRTRAPGVFRTYKNADYAIILEGVNDYHLSNRNTSSTRSNLSSIVRSAETRGAIALLSKLTDVKRDFQRPWVVSVNGKIGRAAKIDFFRLGKSIISSDRLHPNGAGYEVMAELALRKLLEESEANRPLDSDNDGIYDFAESQFGTDKNNPDTDLDGILDGVEVFTYGSNPLLQDSDGDGLNDNLEINQLLSDPTDPRPGPPTITDLELLDPGI